MTACKYRAAARPSSTLRTCTSRRARALRTRARVCVCVCCTSSRQDREPSSATRACKTLNKRSSPELPRPLTRHDSPSFPLSLSLSPLSCISVNVEMINSKFETLHASVPLPREKRRVCYRGIRRQWNLLLSPVTFRIAIKRDFTRYDEKICWT